MARAWCLLALLLSGCALFQPRTVELGDEQWGIVCNITYTGLGRTTTVYLKLEQYARPLAGAMTIDDQCKVTIQADPSRGEPRDP